MKDTEYSRLFRMSKIAHIFNKDLSGRYVSKHWRTFFKTNKS